ncbi:hypothetical protein TNCV_4309211 [Trichonephila clavipes]|nr:hypothetical protein TNCV_4309211 [Trichonephila clavipes]
MEHVMGSFFTKNELPQYCYTLYSLWGNPDKKRERIPKGSISFQVRFKRDLLVRGLVTWKAMEVRYILEDIAGEVGKDVKV